MKVERNGGRVGCEGGMEGET